jgi:Domain of unknown function (DUF4180)
MHMADVLELNGTRVFVAEGLPLKSENDALELVAAAREVDAAWVVVKASQLDESFFRLSTGVAGAIGQKLVNYGLGLALIGELDSHIGNSNAVREANRGQRLWFVKTLDDLKKRLG